MNSLQQHIFMVQEQVYDLTKVNDMTNEEHTELFNLIGWELLNEKIMEARTFGLIEFMKRIQLLINSNKSYEKLTIQLKVLALKLYKYVN